MFLEIKCLLLKNVYYHYNVKLNTLQLNLLSLIRKIKARKINIWPVLQVLLIQSFVN